MENLKKALDYVRNSSPFYQQHFSAHCLEISDYNDFAKLPFTTKEDVASNNLSICCVPKSEIAEVVTTSGTLGEPISIYLTHYDLKRLADNEAYSLSMMGGSKNDCFQLLTTMDKQFIAGLAYYSGVLRLGASIIRLGPGAISQQWKSIIDNEVTKLIAIPSFIGKMLDYADAHKIDYNKTKVDSIICIGEPIHDNNLLPNELHSSVTKRWNVQMKSTYASTEMATAFFQCSNNQGCHCNNNLLFLEVIGEDGLQVANGEVGEIVVTTLKVEGSPLVRYRTGDLATYWNDDCGCGVSSARLGPIIARKNQLIKYKGTTLYPIGLYKILNKSKWISMYHIEVKQEEMRCSELIVYLAKEDFNTHSVAEIEEQFKNTLSIKPNICLKPKRELKDMIYHENSRKPKLISFTEE